MELLEACPSVFGIVGYIIACFAVGCICTIIVAMCRPIKQNDDWKAWKVIVGVMCLVGAVPYGYVEVMTAMHGKELKEGVQDALDEADVQGQMQYFKVVRADDTKAHVIAIATDHNEFGQLERPVMEIDLRKEKGHWSADAYSVVSSYKRQRDGSTMPPYW